VEDLTALQVLAARHPRPVYVGTLNDVRQVSGRDVYRLFEAGLAEKVFALGVLTARLTAFGVSLCEEEGWL
jgi:hypothetical protein